MDLQIQQALLGEGFSGQRIQLEVKNGEKPHEFIYKPHEKYYGFVWMLDGQKPAMIEKVFPELRATWDTPWRPSIYTIYIDHKHPVAVNCPLYLRAVPRGLGSAERENSACWGAVVNISIP